MITLILAAAIAAPAPTAAVVPAAKAKSDCCCDKDKSAKAAMPGMPGMSDTPAAPWMITASLPLVALIYLLLRLLGWPSVTRTLPTGLTLADSD